MVSRRGMGFLSRRSGKPFQAGILPLLSVSVLSVAGCSGTGEENSPSPSATVSPTAAVTPTHTPGTATPGTATPGTATPGTDTPGTDTPGTDTPGTDTPGTSTPTATPGQPTPTATPGADTPTATPGVATPTASPGDVCLSISAVTPITQIQTDVALNGKLVKVMGAIATTSLTPEDATVPQAFYVQDSSGADNSGLRLELDAGTFSGTSPGQLVTVCGIVADNRSTTILETSAAQITLGGSVPVPTPVEIADPCALGSNGEIYEGRLVKVNDVTTTTATGPNQTFTVNACLQIGTEFFPYQNPPYPQPDQPFKSITGVVRQFGEGVYRLEPRTLADMQSALFSYANPSGESFVSTITVTLNATIAGADVFYTTDGSEPTVSSDSLKAGETLVLDKTTTLKFFAMTAEETEADVHTEEYTRLDGAGSVLISEIAVQGTDQEFIEIYNPTDLEVDLSQYYLTDLSNPDSTTGKMNNAFTGITTGKITGDANDFLVRFPDGTKLGANKRLVVILSQGDGFKTATGVTPDFEVVDKSTSVTNMVLVSPSPAPTGTTLPGLSNGQEFVLLFTWDGTSKLVKDVDYFRWAAATNNNVGVDRTGLSVGGETYKADIALTKTSTLQEALPSHSNSQSFCRKDLSEGTEPQTGGNGVEGAVETGENLSTTWEVCVQYTPGE